MIERHNACKVPIVPSKRNTQKLQADITSKKCANKCLLLFGKQSLRIKNEMEENTWGIGHTVRWTY